MFLENLVPFGVPAFTDSFTVTELTLQKAAKASVPSLRFRLITASKFVPWISDIIVMVVGQFFEGLLVKNSNPFPWNWP
jgi:hypothetical protein